MLYFPLQVHIADAIARIDCFVWYFYRLLVSSLSPELQSHSSVRLYCQAQLGEVCLVATKVSDLVGGYLMLSFLGSLLCLLLL